MESTIDDTTLSTISLLEGRLLRIEHLLYGSSVPLWTTSATRSLQDLEHRFSKLLQHIRVYGELLKLSLSAGLAALLPRMKGIEATQLAQAAEIADLLARSEAVVRRWYKHDVMGYSDFVAGVEGRVERVERAVRRVEKTRDEI
ncbi:hypothetical protein CIB48_g240 [Xylaria polymorpha]|nr:hypothetical protein CIB48_g240 [Xylaria polymorpha]